MRKDIEQAEQQTRFRQFNSALRTTKRFGLTVEEVASLISLNTRTMFRILAKERPVEHEDLIQIQTVVLTLLCVQMKSLKDPSFDLRKVRS